MSDRLSAEDMVALTATAFANRSRIVPEGDDGIPESGGFALSPGEHMAVVLALALIGLIGFLFNLVVIMLMWKDKQLWTPLNRVLFNLICSDFSVAVFGNPWTLSSAVCRQWIWGRFMCKVYGFFMSLLGINSITTLSVLAFERYMIVVRPFHKLKMSTRTARFSVLFIWIYSLALTVPPLVGWGDYVNEAANISCSVNWENRSRNTMTYIVFLFVFGLVVPVAVITFSYVNIISTMRQTKIRTGRVSKAEARITTMVLVMIVAFIVAWSPYAAVALIIQFGDPNWLTPTIGVLPAIIAKSSICYNPIIYVGMNTQFRQSWKQLFHSGRPGDLDVKYNTVHTNVTPMSSRNINSIRAEYFNNAYKTKLRPLDLSGDHLELTNLPKSLAGNTQENVDGVSSHSI